MSSVSPLTLHIRLTKACNATCSYCSSWQESPDNRIRPSEFGKMISFILDTAPEALGFRPSHITAQFLGGEIATVPAAELEENIALLKTACASRRLSLSHGIQSNLVVSPGRAARLYDLFDGRLGTSIDLTGSARTVRGSAEEYRLIWREADRYLRKNRSTPGAVYVLDGAGLTDAHLHLVDSARVGRMLTIRPVFQGGTPGQQLRSADEIEAAMAELFQVWFMRLPIIVEPFFQLTQSRLAELTGLGQVLSTACAFQHDCTKKSLNLDPNGDLHVCLEMADARMAPIGNAKSGVWYSDALHMYSSRSTNLHADCRQCSYLKSCQGGCMFESMTQGHGVHGKSNYCGAWKSLFRLIDEGIEFYGPDQVHAWLHRIATRHENERSDGLVRATLEQIERGIACAAE